MNDSLNFWQIGLYYLALKYDFTPNNRLLEFKNSVICGNTASLQLQNYWL